MGKEAGDSVIHLVGKGDSRILHPWLIIGRRICHLAASIALSSPQAQKCCLGSPVFRTISVATG